MKIEIVFRDEMEISEDIENPMEVAYDLFLDYLNDCVRCGDVSAFQFYKMKEVQTNE